MRSVYFISENRGWIVGSPSIISSEDPAFTDTPALILRTTDGGENWTEIKNFPQFDSNLRGFNDVVFMDSTVGYAVGRMSKIIKTIDGGKTWEEKYISDYRGHTLSSIFYIDGKIWTVGSYSQILFSSDLGETWNQQYVNLNQNLYSVYFSDQMNGWAVGNQGSLIYTEDGGNNWYKKYFSGSSNIPSSSFRSIIFSENRTGWIATWFGYLLSTNKTITEVNDDVRTEKNMVWKVNNYPNPFNPTTKIQYSIPQSSKVSIKIYDTMGREIKTLLNENKTPGNYEIEFDGSGLSSGVYFYRINAGKYSETKKMLLLK